MTRGKTVYCHDEESSWAVPKCTQGPPKTQFHLHRPSGIFDTPFRTVAAVCHICAQALSQAGWLWRSDVDHLQSINPKSVGWGTHANKQTHTHTHTAGLRYLYTTNYQRDFGDAYVRDLDDGPTWGELAIAGAEHKPVPVAPNPPFIARGLKLPKKSNTTTWKLLLAC